MTFGSVSQCARAALRLAACAALVAAAASAARAQLEPQQSKTGPLPPPSVASKLLQAAPAPGAVSKTIAAPGYLWRHGCGPTAVGMVVGYYDGRGYGDLISGDAVTQTPAVDQALASQGDALNPRHYQDYSLPLDSWNSTPPNYGLQNDKSSTPPGDEHASDSIADFMQTSWSSRGNYYGWSWSSDIGPAFVSYVNSRKPVYGPSYQAYYMVNSTLTWNVLTNEIDNGRPMVFLVDSDSDGATDHFVCVVGYRDSPALQYGCLDTWAPADVVRWCDFLPMLKNRPWGVWGAWSLQLAPPDTAAIIDGILGRTGSAGLDVNGDSAVDIRDVLSNILGGS